MLGKYLTNEEKMGVNRDEFSTDGGRVTESESFHVNGVTETSPRLNLFTFKKKIAFLRVWGGRVTRLWDAALGFPCASPVFSD